MKKISGKIMLVIAALTFASCGKKGSMSYPGGQEKPEFDRVFDE